MSARVLPHKDESIVGLSKTQTRCPSDIEVPKLEKEARLLENASTPLSEANNQIEAVIGPQIGLSPTASLGCLEDVSKSSGRGGNDQPTGRHVSQVPPVEVTNVTPAHSACGSHRIYVLRCRHGDVDWSFGARYSAIRRVYDITKESNPEIDTAVPFPPKRMVQSLRGSFERAEGLLLWLSTYSSYPAVHHLLLTATSDELSTTLARQRKTVS